MSIKPSNADRVLIALSGCQQYLDRFEYPRRYSQRGLVERLGMAQSHISREVTILISKGLLISERRRVANERKRVTAYLLTEKGQGKVEELSTELGNCKVLHQGEDGELKRDLLKDLVANVEPLEWANILKHAKLHDGLPLIEINIEGDEGELDLSSETITLLIEMAQLKMITGDTIQAALHLRRAATLHRRAGNAFGEAKCLLIAAGLDGHLGDIKHLHSLVDKVGESLFSADELLALGGSSHKLGDANALQQAIQRGRDLSLLLVSKEVEEVEVLDVIRDLSNGAASRPELVANIALKHGSQAALEAAWALDLSVNTRGHVGFSLFQLSGDKSILQRLKESFEEIEDAAGVEVCVRLLSS